MESFVPNFVPSSSDVRLEQVPVSNVQEYLWDKVESGDHTPQAMNIAVAVGLKGTIDIQALESAVNELIDQTEILRTNFRYVDGKKTQVIHKKRQFLLDVKDYRRSDKDRRDEWIRARKKSLSERVFDTGSDILIRGCLFRMEDDAATAFFVIHHFAFDGYSRRPFVEILMALYNAKTGRKQPDPYPASQYADFALWERALPSGLMKSNQDYWKEKLGGFTESGHSPKAREGKSSVIKFVVTGGLRDAIQKAARCQNGSLFVGLCAVFAASLMKWKGTNDIIVWFPCIQRDAAELTNMIGPVYVNLPLRVRVTGDPTFAEMMNIVRTDVLEAVEHQWIGNPQLSQIAGRKQPLGINFTNVGRGNVAAASAKDRSRPFYLTKRLKASAEKHPSELMLAMENASDGLRAAFSYDVGCYSRREMTSMVNEFCSLAQRWSNEPGLPLSAAMVQQRATQC